ncbi:DoxX family protein [Mycolicibacterium sp. GCM10028919]|uniref:DoxX family protein n=1 Tax=Mycolicibacterium sp. GCM10028919 TaxID=3273401 RepID=UPI003623322B
MTPLPDPQWPIIALAVVQFVDALMCLKPLAFIAQCFEGVGWPRRLWWLMPPIKFAAAAGLLAGLWIPYLGAITCAALVVYFLCAIAAHVRARDFGRNLFLNATGMLVICVAVGVYCFLI